MRAIWFLVSGIEGKAGKIGVEAYALNRITKDILRHPISVALKWDHLLDLKMADFDFSTQTCTDLLLGAEVFTSLLCDRRQTAPQGTPSAINT